MASLLHLSAAAASGAPAHSAWAVSTWHGETAYAIETSRWRAIVSIDRARLVHFGPAGSDENLVYAPETMHEPIGWGGHRAWLGPQLEWAAIWPPAAAWESRPPDAIEARDSRLELTMAQTGDGWPRISRLYEIEAGQLACRVQIHPGGTRAVQVMHVLQVTMPPELTATVAPREGFPHGFVLLPPIGGRKMTTSPDPLPTQVERRAAPLVALRRGDRPEKYGFAPQTLVASGERHELHVGRGPVAGFEVGAPDEGFYSQIYLGPSSSTVIELEQLSPRFKAGEAAEFTMLLEVRAR